MSDKISKVKVGGSAVKAATAPSSSSSAKKPAAMEVVEQDPRVKKILQVRKIVRDRDQARIDGEFGKADTIRDQLLEKFNVELIDQKGGPSGWKFKDGTSNKLPAGINLPEPVSGKKRSRDEPQNNAAPSNKDNNGEKKKVKINPQQAAAAAKPAKPVKLSAEQERNRALVSNLVAPTGAERKVQGVTIEDMKIGTGATCKIGDRIKMHYTGKLKTTGKVFDSSVKKPFVFRLGRGEVIAGWDIGCQGMAVGGKRKLTIPPEKAYGRAGAPPTIPSNATLVFEVQLIDIA